MSDDNERIQELRDALSELFCEEVDFDLIEESRDGDAFVLIIGMEYLRRGSSGRSTRIRQTAVVLDDPQSDFPNFAFWPHQKGVVGMLAGGLAAMGDIDIEDAPDFSEAYHLHGWNEASVRSLFNRELRDHLAGNAGWSGRASRHLAVVYRAEEICDGSKLDDFRRQSCEILELLQKSEAAMDERSELRREANVQDVLATAERMGGIHAMLLKKEIEKRHVSSADLNAFLAKPLPRSDAPSGLRYQVGGDNLVLILLGAVFIIAGIATATLVLMLAPPRDRIIALPFGIVFPMIGAPVLFFSLRHRRRRQRLLRYGVVTTGRVKKLKRTNVHVNNAQRYHLHLEFELDGRSRSAVENLYSNVEAARGLESSGKPVRVLVDPEDPSRVLCIDTLLIFD